MDISLDPSMLSSERMIDKLKTLSQSGNDKKSQEELKNVAREFESVFVNILIKEMWKTIPESGLFEESAAMDGYTDIMQSALSDEISKLGGLGIADALYEQLQKNLVLAQSDMKEKE